ncbi:MAG: hypothetical protein A4S09_16335 [Proteobacteria bacterium SG_bin7]|nr:MAG: hypothetical protein A4S09_16335 [Proteobacteria bacterium SG_bin7]
MGIKTPHNFRPEELKNYIINGDMGIAQRGTSFTALGISSVYLVDRFFRSVAGSTNKGQS